MEATVRFVSVIRTKWLIYTVLLGLTPFLIRLLILVLSNHTIWNEWLQPGDFVTFTLIIASSNINLLEHDAKVARSHKTMAIGLSVVIVTFAAVIFTAACLQQIRPDIMSPHKLAVAALVLGIASVALSFTVWYRLPAVSVGDRS